MAKIKQDSISPKEWIIPCNLNYYDLSGALTDLKIVDWIQPTVMNNAKVGDFVYVYCKPIKGVGYIGFKGAILAVNKPGQTIDDTLYSSDTIMSEKRCFEIAVFREYEFKEELDYPQLKAHGLKSTLRGPVIVKGELADYLHICDAGQRQADRLDGNIPDTCCYPFPIEVKEIVASGNVNALDPKTHTEEEIAEHARSLSDEQLRKLAEKQGRKKPKIVNVSSEQRVRNTYVSEHTKRRARGICQLCKVPAPFSDGKGEPYLESHHIVWLSQGGSDTIDNTAALCPNCHRKMHIINDPADIIKLKEELAQWNE